jgi:hypothetical protein
MKLSFTPVHKMRPCIFLSAFSLCVLMTGYYDQANDSTPCPGYGYFNLNDDSNGLDLHKHRIRHSDPGINCVVFHIINEIIVSRILLEKPTTVASFNIITDAYRTSRRVILNTLSKSLRIKKEMFIH